jgi:hypothetical protein
LEPPTSAYEALRDMKFGIRLHWGIYSIWHRGPESWPFLNMTFEDRQEYKDRTETWNPAVADPLSWNYDAARGLGFTIPEKLQNEGARPCQYAWTFKIESVNA